MKKSLTVITFAVVTALACNTAGAQALLAPVENLAINRAEAAILTRVAIQRGFAANDPRIAATLTSIGNVSTALNVVGTGASLAVGFAGAPVWLSVAAGLGVFAAGAAILAGAVTLTRSFDGKTITAQQPMPQGVGASYSTVAAPTPPSGVMLNAVAWAAQQGIPVYHTASCISTADCARYPGVPTTGNKNFDYDTGLGYEVIPNTIAQVQQFETYDQQFAANGGNNPPIYTTWTLGSVIVSWVPNASGTDEVLQETVFGQQQVINQTTGQISTQPFTNVQVLTRWTIGPGVKPASGTDLSQVYPKLSSDAISQPLDPSTLAQLTNQSWQQAAGQPGYSGLPYSATQPISYSDVQPWVQANPSSAPNVGDLFRPASDPGTAVVVISPTVQPGTSTGGNQAASGTSDVNVINTPNVNIVNKVSVDLGADPGVQSPTLETTPTISMILAPVVNMLPDFKAWSVPSHGAVCPTPAFTVLGSTFTLQAHCDLAETYRTEIYGSFVAMFTLAALFIVLGA